MTRKTLLMGSLLTLVLSAAMLTPRLSQSSDIIVFECSLFLQIAPAPGFSIQNRYTFRRHIIETEPTDEFFGDGWAQGRFANNGTFEIDVYPTEGEVATEKGTSLRTFILDGITAVNDEIIDDGLATENVVTFEDFTIDSFNLTFTDNEGTVLNNHLDYPDVFDLADYERKECLVTWRAPAPVPCGSVGTLCDTGTHRGNIISVSFLPHEESHGFEINAGLNDAWVSADAPLQGMFVTVFPDLEFIFLAWFTFDSVALAPAQEAIRESSGQFEKTVNSSAVFGADDQRWVTALGSYSGDSASLKAELTSGGKFHSSDPIPSQDTEYGTIDLKFKSCSEGVVTYNFPSAMLSGQFNIGRVLNDNVALCEALAAP
jgi:hypothetical protein